MVKVYGYKGCDGCRKAKKWLTEQGVDFEEIAIREQPPTVDELNAAYEDHGSLKPLFNKSGMDYRSLGLKDKLPGMALEEALELLAGNGNLVKRPFVIDGETFFNGFKPDAWSEHFA